VKQIHYSIKLGLVIALFVLVSVGFMPAIEAQQKGAYLSGDWKVAGQAADKNSTLPANWKADMALNPDGTATLKGNDGWYINRNVGNWKFDGNDLTVTLSYGINEGAYDNYEMILFSDYVTENHMRGTYSFVPNPANGATPPTSDKGTWTADR
jgi:hypothetical protein